jgi:uncharacterized lipoprotein NlpE involved in copper resistance
MQEISPQNIAFAWLRCCSERGTNNKAEYRRLDQAHVEDKWMSVTMEYDNGYRTVIPERFVYILAAMFIDASSWKSSFAAYGIWICEILVLFLHGRHSKEFFLRFL